MKKFLPFIILIAFFIIPKVSSAALSNYGIFEINASSTAANVNAGYFNPDNANMATDGTVDANTGNTASPVFSSASANFDSTDIYDWLFIKSNTGNDVYQNCWYRIVSVASNKATLDASAGNSYCRLEKLFATSTNVGISSVATPTNITWSVDYSQATTSPKNWVSGGSSFTNDMAATNASPSVATSASHNFDARDVGNGIHFTAGTNLIAAATSRWAEIVSVSGGAATLDKNITSGAGNLSSGTAYLGGAMSLNSTLDDDLFEQALPGMQFYIKHNYATLSFGEAVSVSTTGYGLVRNPVYVISYENNRADFSPSSRKQLLNHGANNFGPGQFWNMYGFNITQTSTTGLTTQTANKCIFCSSVNTSTTADRPAVQSGNTNYWYGLHAVSYRGQAFGNGNGAAFAIYGCYIHDSKYGIRRGATNNFVSFVSDCVIADNTDAAIEERDTNQLLAVYNNMTLYGAENKMGIGFNAGEAQANIHLTNSIFYGFVTAASTTAQFSSTTASTGGFFFRNNNYYNNTANFYRISTSSGDTYLDPQFTNVAQITGTGATSATNVVTMSGANLSNVVANQDFFTFVSGTGTGIPSVTTKFLITAVDDGADTVTLSSNLTSSGNGTNIVWQITTGKNFEIGTNLKGLGEPNYFVENTFSSFKDKGGLEREEQGSSSVIPSWAY